MSLRSYPNRVLWVATLASAVVLCLTGALAYYLDTQQAETAAFLSENIGSRKAAVNLESSLADLIALHEDGVERVDPLQERVKARLREVEKFSDKPRERELADEVIVCFENYLRDFEAERRSGTKSHLSYQRLKGEALQVCQQLQSFNDQQIEESEKEHRTSLRRMSESLILVGGLGSIMGLILGYRLARGLRQTIHQFLVRVQGASEMLGQEVPMIEWKGEGFRAEDGADDLVERVEKVVKRLQETDRDMRRAERLAAVGQLAAGVAHEIRNPLTSAILLIETCRNDPSAGGLTEEDLALIEAELHRIEFALNTFLDFARPPKLERRNCDLIAVVRDSLQLARGRLEQQDIEVRFNPPRLSFELNGDREQLRQLLLNLVLNALDAMPYGGRLEIALKIEPDTLVLTVADSGAGIRPDILPRLFEPFATGKETGLGLGLVICKRIVEDHGGTLVGYNLPHAGACFEAKLPLGERTPCEKSS